ncbi:hypothetical protein [Peribacillus sp. SCS-37]|uniref:hypothetical protein n=1 Tax=Paraperibacillus esterisolvens TaxID=3115296 RepID=UPI0039061EB9
MLILSCKGYELEKAMPTTSEDFFNKSVACYRVEGLQKSLHIVYVRYFEGLLSDEAVPYSGTPLFSAGSRDIYPKDAAALAALIKHPEYCVRKRVYISEAKEFTSLFKGLDMDRLKKVFEELENKGEVLVSPAEFKLGSR